MAFNYGLLASIVAVGASGGTFDATQELMELKNANLVQTGNFDQATNKVMARATDDGVKAHEANAASASGDQGFGGFGGGAGFGGDTAQNGSTFGSDSVQTNDGAAGPTSDAAAPGKGIGKQIKPGSINVITSGFTPPAKKRSPILNAGSETYPFSTMAVGAAFFIGNSEVAKGDAVKTLSSAVSAANRRFATEAGEYNIVIKGVTKTRKAYKYAQYFEYAAGTRDQANPQSEAGVWVWRSDKKSGHTTGPGNE